MLLQSGRYFDTIGWMSAKLDDNRSDQDLEITRRYLDNNVQTYMVCSSLLLVLVNVD